MDTNLTNAIESFFREQGFEMAADASERAYSLTGSKGAVSAFVQLAHGRREKGRPLVYAVPSTPAPESNGVVRPMLHASAPTDSSR